MHTLEKIEGTSHGAPLSANEKVGRKERETESLYTILIMGKYKELENISTIMQTENGKYITKKEK